MFGFVGVFLIITGGLALVCDYNTLGGVLHAGACLLMAMTEL